MRIAGYVTAAALLAAVLVMQLSGGEGEPRPEPTPAGSPSEEASPGAEPTAIPPPKDAPYRFVFRKMDASGAFVGRVTNGSGAHAFIQCLIAARDENGQLALGRTYEAFDPDGNPVETDLYTAFVELDPGHSVLVDVELLVTAQVAEYSATCEERPDPDDAQPEA